MTQIVVSIPDAKVKSFLNFINELRYVKVEDKTIQIPAWQKKEVRKRLKIIASNPAHLVSSKEALSRLKALRV